MGELDPRNPPSSVPTNGATFVTAPSDAAGADRRGTPLRIFISYRREDAGGHALSLYEPLVERFGRDNVFMDIHAIEAGRPYPEIISRWVGSCDVLIALIGRQWATIADANGRRIDHPNDLVVLEIRAALDRQARVVPALVQKAELPTPVLLPETLRELADYQALELSDVRWRYDVGRLIETLEVMEREKWANEARLALGSGAVPTGVAPPPPPPPAEAPGAAPPSRQRKLERKAALIVGAGIGAAVVGAGLLFFLFRSGSQPTVTLSDGPSGTVGVGPATFEFASSTAEVAFECSLDGEPFSSCSSPVTIDVGVGEHTIRVRAVDEGGAGGPAASRTWTAVDTVSPDLAISSDPPRTVGENSIEFDFSSSEEGVSFACSLDGAEFAACSSPTSYDGLTEGEHSFRVTASDDAGNTSEPASRTWTIQLANPYTGPFPNAAEELLLAQVPQRFRATCDRYDDTRPTGADAYIICEDGAVGAYYTHFTSRSAMYDIYARAVAFVSGGRNTGGCIKQDPTNGEEAWVNGGLHGRVSCFIYEGNAWFEWTEETTLIFGQDYRDDSAAAALQDWWVGGRANPV